MAHEDHLPHALKDALTEETHRIIGTTAQLELITEIYSAAQYRWTYIDWINWLEMKRNELEALTGDLMDGK